MAREFGKGLRFDSQSAVPADHRLRKENGLPLGGAGADKQWVPGNGSERTIDVVAEMVRVPATVASDRSRNARGVCLRGPGLQPAIIVREGCASIYYIAGGLLDEFGLWGRESGAPKPRGEPVELPVRIPDLRDELERAVGDWLAAVVPPPHPTGGPDPAEPVDQAVAERWRT